MHVVAIAGALGLAFVLGISSAPNATSALVASRAAPWHAALGFSFLLHALGALLGGTAVALTIAGLVSVPAADVATVYAAGCVATIGFVAAAARLGLPTSATHGLIGGLTGAALWSGGIDAVNWGGLDGIRPLGTLGALLALVVSPIVGVAAGWAARRLALRAFARGTRRLLAPVKGGIWVAAGAVALTDGTNDGQKAMGVAATTLVATGAIDGFRVPLWVRVSVAVVLGLGTVIGGGRVIRRVSRGYYRPSPLDSLASQTSAAAVIFGSTALGAPVSTSSVVTAAVVGVGADRHPRHVRWAGVADTISAWFLTVPVCAALGAALSACASLFA
ncbi:MAG: inorganic phosphate transporter [Gaiella sp.]|nr:inorganic phosphate transporter [Gaiella sp.]